MRVRSLAILCFTLTLAVIGITPTANAASAYDSVVQLDSSLVLNGNNVTDSYYSDVTAWSASHPENVKLADAVAAWEAAMDAGIGWSLLKCPSISCGGGGFGEIIISPPASYYHFFDSAMSPYFPSFGVECENATCAEIHRIIFRYDPSGTILSVESGAAATGTLFDGTKYYSGFEYVTHNPDVSSRIVYVNAPIFYPSGYAGAWVPSEYTPPVPQPYSGTVDCGGKAPLAMIFEQGNNDGSAVLTPTTLGRADWEYSLTYEPYAIAVLCGDTWAYSYTSVYPGQTSGDWVCDPYTVRLDQAYCVLG